MSNTLVVVVVNEYTHVIGSHTVLRAMLGAVVLVLLLAGTEAGATWVVDDDVTLEPAPSSLSPVALITYSPTNPNLLTTITFDASASHDLDGEIVSYKWDFGDGDSVEGVSGAATHSYSKAGTYIVTLTVTDNDGLQDSDSIALHFGVKNVILIYGLLSEPSTWDTMKERLEDEGYTVDVWDYAPGSKTATGSINGYANRLEDHIKSNYKDIEKIDIVAHSMGGLITRAYLKNEKGNPKIRKFIMIGTPNNGSELCYLIDDDTLEFLKHIPISFIQDFAKMAENEPAFEQLTPGSHFLLWLNSDFTHLDNTEVHTIAGTDDTWNDLETFQIGDITITIEDLGKNYQKAVEPLLVGPDDSVVRVDSVGKTGISPSKYHAVHTGRNPELEHDGIISEVISILGSESQKYSQDGLIGAASSESTNMSIQYAFTDSDTLSTGEEKKYNIPVSFTDDLSFFVGWDTGDLNLTLTTPTGNSINSTTNTTNITYFYYYNETTGGIQGFDITNPEEGDWEIDLVVQYSPELNYSLITLVNSSLTLSITSEKSIYEPEEHINLSSLLMNGDTPLINASVEAEIKKPDGYTESLIMCDDGNHNDGQANDGIYGNVFTNTSLLGRYSITASASNGDFVRESVNRVVWVEEYPDLTLNASDISFSSETPIVGENITINATIHNIGEADANNASILFYDGEPASGEEIGEDVINVSVNATANASVSWLAKAGVHEIHVLISPYNEFLEENYTNNMANKTIEVTTLPIANFTYSPESPVLNQIITFNATNSTDPDGIIVSYEWNFSDGNITATPDPVITHAYAEAGAYTVTLTVTDNDCATDTNHSRLTVKAPVETATGTGTAYFASDAGTIKDLTALNEPDLPEENPDADFPHGLFSFNITGLSNGETVNVTIDFPQDIPTTAQYWKYNTSSREWYQIPIGSNDGDRIIAITLQDGGVGDNDGAKNGIISDPGGHGIPRTHPVPSMTPVGTAILVGSLSLLAVGRIRRRFD